MTNQRRRLSKIDERLSAAVKERKRKDQEKLEALLFSAHHHATAAAAIVLAGQPKIDEPLIEAWNRALKHYGVESKPWRGIKDQIEAEKLLRSKILEGKEQSARFSEIFAAAPVWFLQFTGLAWDARLLKFTLPDISRSRFDWGDAGYEDARSWPRLPSGMITAGDPIPSDDIIRQFWLIGFCMVKEGDIVQAFNDGFSAEEEELPSTGDALLDEMLWATPFLFDERTVDELPPHEKRRVLKLLDRVSRLPKQPHKRKRSSR
jgi:hypothetical protein